MMKGRIYGAFERTVDGDITHGVGPILFFLRRPVIFAQLSCEMPQHRIALRQDLAVDFNNGHVGGRVFLRDDGLFVFWVFLESVADVCVGNAGVLPHQADDLATAAGCKVQVVDGGDAADGFVGGTGGAILLCGRHGGLIWICRAILNWGSQQGKAAQDWN